MITVKFNSIQRSIEINKASLDYDATTREAIDAGKLYDAYVRASVKLPCGCVLYSPGVSFQFETTKWRESLLNEPTIESAYQNEVGLLVSALKALNVYITL